MEGMFFREIPIIGVCLMVLFSTIPGIAADSYVVSNWGMEDGLPQSSVNQVIQSQDGYLWLATFGGLVRFDGVNFTTFNRFNTPGMKSDRILNLYEDKNGNLWLGTEDGFFRFRDGVCKSFSIEQQSQIYAPRRVSEDSDGTLWIAVNEQIYRLKDSAFVEVAITRGSALREKALENNEGTWLAFSSMIFKTLGEDVVLIDDLDQQMENNIVDIVEYPKDSKKLYLATNGDGILEYHDGRSKSMFYNSAVGGMEIWRFYIDRRNRLLATTFTGVLEYAEDSFVPFSGSEALETRKFNSVVQDGEGNYWMGTPNAGLYKFQPSVISMIDADQGLANQMMLSLSRFNDGSMVFATNCGGIYEWRDGKAHPSAINAYMPNQCVWSVFQDSKGQIWMGSRVLYRTNSLNRPGNLIGEMQGFSGIDIFAITEDRRGRIWVGALNGIYIFDGDEVHRISSDDGLSYNDTRVFFEDELAAMWVGTSAGLNLIRDDKVSPIPLIQPKGEESVNQPYVRAIHKDDSGVMWFGTYGNGLFRLAGDTLTNITADDGLFDNIISHIEEDENGNFWLGCNRGIFSVNKADLNAFCRGNAVSVPSYSFGVADGMNTAETNGGFQPSVLNDGKGRLYFPTVEGIAVISTSNITHNSEPPAVYIETLRTSEEQLPLQKALSLPFNNAFLEIGYTGLSFVEPKKITFKYRMTGLDREWIDVGNRRTALYTKIPPGKYTFHVVAANKDGVWNTAGAKLNITVIPPFWQTMWFYSLMGLIFIALGPAAYYVRVKQLKKENERQKRFTEQLIESQEQERRRIASELHDGLGQQILVIKNRVDIASQFTGKPDQMMEQLDEISQSATRSIADVRNISHNLRPVLLEKFGLTEALENLFEQLQQSTTINWKFELDDVDGLIPQQKEINFYRVIQEGTNNVIRHSNAKSAEIRISRDIDQIAVAISDSGQGFDVRTEKVLEGLGFLGMRERISSLGGRMEVYSRPGEGTELKFVIPLMSHG